MAKRRVFLQRALNRLLMARDYAVQADARTSVKSIDRAVQSVKASMRVR